MKIKINENEKLIYKNVFFSFLIKGGALVISFLTTPVFLSYFNEDKLVVGVWYTLLSVLSWVMTFDFGIANGMRNKLTEAFSKKDNDAAKKVISSGFFSVLVLTLLFAVVCFVGIQFIDLNSVFNISVDVISQNVLKNVIIIVLSAILMKFFLMVISSIFYALHLSFVNNVLGLISSVLQFLFVLLIHFENKEDALLYVSIAFLVTSNLPVIIAAIILFVKKLRNCTPSLNYITKDGVKNVVGVGTIFFTCQIFFMILNNTNEFVISKLYGPENTTDYSFYYKLFNLLASIVTLACTPIWSVVTKAMTENDYTWLKSLFKKLKYIAILATLAQFAMIPFLQFIVNIWLGKGVLQINYLTAVGFAFYSSIIIYIGILSVIVSGLLRMKLQTIYYGIAVVIKFAIIFLTASLVKNWDFIIWCTALVLLPYLIIQQIDLDKYFNRKIKENNLLNNCTEGTICMEGSNE